MKTLCVLAFASLVALPAFAQAPAAPRQPHLRQRGGQLAMVKGYITKSAEQVPENLYGFKATPDVRSFGQLFGARRGRELHDLRARPGRRPGERREDEDNEGRPDRGAGDSFAYCEKALGDDRRQRRRDAWSCSA